VKTFLLVRPVSFVALIWLCFILRGFFYCSFLPLWEGYDEWAHFAYVERLATSGRLLADRSEPVSRRVQASMQLVPMPWGTAKPAISEDEYWRLPPAERAARVQQLRAIPLAWSSQPDPSGPPIYEALQPPLYYWIEAPLCRLFPDASLFSQVLLTRYFGVVITSLAIPLIFLIGRRVLGNTLAAGCVAALVAVMPGLMIDVARAGNECLGILIYSWLALVCLDLAEEKVRRKTGIWIGMALGLGLLTKAYFLTAIPAVGLIFAWRFWRARRTGETRLISVHALWAIGLTLLISAWWYVRNRIYTGTWSGLLESVKVQHYSAAQFFEGMRGVNWRGAIDSILLSHIWFGGWSSLQVRSWMYHLLFLIIALGVLGISVALIDPKKRRCLYPLIALYAFFWVGQLYNVLLLFLTKGASTSMGWYMYCVIAAEVTLLVFGLQTLLPNRFRSWAVAFLVLLIAALDLYTVHFVSIPYYTGLIAHPPGRAVAAFHLSQLNNVGIGEILVRICSLKPLWLEPSGLAFAWACYISATLILIGLAFWLARPQPLVNGEPQ
jgi:Dolichyl-phosphate-mannose-protein mannosyltransferase